MQTPSLTCSSILLQPLVNSDNHVRLIDFFKFYSRDFAYNTGVASIKAGLLKKEDKGWLCDVRRDVVKRFLPVPDIPVAV